MKRRDKGLENKKGILKKSAAFLFLSAMIVGVFTACMNKGGKDDSSSKERVKLFSYYGCDVYLDEAMIYAKVIEESYEAAYGEDIWNITYEATDGSKVNFEELIKEETVEQMKMVKVMITTAEEEEIALTEEEQEEMGQQAKTFYEGLTDQQIEEMGISLEVVVRVYEENRLADKAYEKLVADKVREISDEEARVTKVYDLLIPAYEYAADVVIPLGEEQRQEALAEATEALDALNGVGLEEGMVPPTIEEYAKTYGYNESGEIYFEQGEAAAKYGEEYETKMYELSEGQYSSVIETKYGYHIIYMITLTDEEKTAQRKAEMIEELEKDAFDAFYHDLTLDAEKKWNAKRDINTIWDEVSFQ
ncbi:MAG: peptidylprolyl isomerase [Lachnospiraceae bacterium]|nr:peptidylprolyl isomerase [Lachnospiraceae bacterium]